MSKNEIQKAPWPTRTSTEGDPEELVKIGQWYWVRNSDEEPWFGCVIHIGSNYAELQAPQGGSVRIHFDDFLNTCKHEIDPDGVIKSRVAGHQAEVQRLLGRVKEITAQLAISPGPSLSSSNEVSALAIRGEDQDMKGYGVALEKAKKETLPDLFNQVQSHNSALASWMSAQIIPLKVQAAGLNPIINSINERIFSVEIYAGLSEKIVKVRDGDPASIDDKVHLMQRRCYMDEECLSQYQTGGMTFSDIESFDEWISTDEQLHRIFPFPRCIVSFRVRRNEKQREIVNLIDFFHMMEDQPTDMFTFLYIRNGNQLFRMCTKIDFGKHLFPEMKEPEPVGKLWAKMFASRIEEIISDNEYNSIMEDHKAKESEWEKEYAEYEIAVAKAKEREADGGKGNVEVSWPGHRPHLFYSYEPFDKSSVYFDDISKKVQSEIRSHNNIALVIQGLLDRSPVLHPHPPWQIWTESGFRSALTLIYDDTRALVSGEKPDFEAYRKKLNSTLKNGSVTVGQENAWLRHEGQKESDRRDRDPRYSRDYYRPGTYRPHGNPGPGVIARVVNYNKKKSECTYAWNRNRQNTEGDPIRTTFVCDSKWILNVDAYKPGDFRQFFSDPRTRAEYLEWAPFLLEAEEYHAGNRKVLEPPSPSPPKESSWEGQRRYENRKIRKSLIGKAVRLNHKVTMKSGVVYEEFTLWRVISGRGNEISVRGIGEDGKFEETYRGISNLNFGEVEVDSSIPGEFSSPSEE